MFQMRYNKLSYMQINREMKGDNNAYWKAWAPWEDWAVYDKNKNNDAANCVILE